MLNSKSASCFVLARGGSKRIPHKNIRDFNGQPMVSWPVSVAVKSALFDATYISTDSPNIESVAITYGAKSLGLRPANLANDFAGTAEVIAHCLEELSKNSIALPEFVCCLYGTSAFVTRKVLQKSLALLEKADTQCVLAVSAYKHPIERALIKTQAGHFEYLNPESAQKRTQDCLETYHDIGLFYWLRVSSFLELASPSFVPLRKAAVVIPASMSVDIDTEEDWIFAEKLAKLSLEG